MSENLSFKFYSVLKNEDADPFSENGLMVVADGLGGAGSVVHELDAWCYKNDLEAVLINYALHDYDAEKHTWLTPYLKKWVEPMQDSSPDTSALWASRIAIARFVYALMERGDILIKLSDKKTRAELSEYITEGLKNVCSNLNLQAGKYENQKMLPTTLAALAFTESEDSVSVEAVWAGDSRCYALTAEGLKQLTIDDEDAAEAITNLFYVGDKSTTLHYRRYEFKKPCILLAVSDGVFDPYSPYDNLGVEAVLLEHIKRCKSTDELCKALKVHYDNVHGDDATMAFEAFGFTSYQNMQRVLSDRTEKTLAMWKKYREMRSSLNMIESEDAANDIVDKTINRTRDRIDAIAAILAQVYAENKADFLLDNEQIAVLRASLENQKQEFEGKAKTFEAEALQLAKDEMLLGYAHLDEIFLESITPETDQAARAYNALKSFATGYHDAEQRLHKANEDRIRARAEGDRLLGLLNRRRVELHRKMEDINFHFEDCQLLETEYIALIEIRNNLQYKRQTCYRVANKVGEATVLAKLIDENLELRHGIMKRYSAAERDRDKFKQQYESAVEAFFRFSPSLYYDAPSLFRRGFITKCGLGGTSREFTITPMVIAAMGRSLLNYYNSQPDICERITERLAKHYDEKSAIDSCYNDTRLSNFRQYYRLKDTSIASAHQFKADLEALIAEYESLLK